MPRGNCIRLLSFGGLLLTCLGLVPIQSSPLVIGYERFHSDQPSVEGGRILYNELGCANCHAPNTGLPPRKGPMLEGILDRKQAKWIHTFLLDSARTQSGTSMPNMPLTTREVEALLHFLGTLDAEKPVPDAFRFVNAERGKILFHEIGCVACHDPSPDFNPPEGKLDKEPFTFPGIPLTNLGQKYDFDSLNAFLYRPHDYWPNGRMPKFKLDREDGGDLTAYLLNYQNGDSTEYPSIKPFQTDPDLADIGKIVFELRQCTSCHDVEAAGFSPQIIPTPNSTEIKNLNTLEFHPEYELTENQSKSLQRFLVSKPSPTAPVTTHLETLNCLACHVRDGIGGPDLARKSYFAGDHDLGDTGRLPPPLTEAGRKFQPDWLTEAINGNVKLRPYLRTQMPVFGESVQGLDKTLIKADKVDLNPKVPKANIEAGRALLGTQGGLNCITCHHWREHDSLGIQALDISNLSKRLQLGWLQDYLIEPAHFRPNTLMPSFWPNGQASNHTILDGDTQAQIAAIYAFSRDGAGIPEGFPNINSTDYEIVPTDRPVVQRSFMEGVGTHAILVGFPEGVHLAYDAATGQPAMLWKGRFFDAYRTWFSRFPEFEKPLGEDIVVWPETHTKPTAQYRGYRLDQNGVPEFEIQLFGSKAFERFIPILLADGSVGLKRSIRYTEVTQMKKHKLSHPKSTRRQTIETEDPLKRTFIYQW